MKVFIKIFLLLTISVSVYGQEKSHVLELAAQQNKLMMRWAPKNYMLWQQSIQNGYQLQKLSIAKLLEGSNDWQNLHDTILKPYSLERLKQSFGKDNQNAALAAQMLYGKSKVNNAGSMPEQIVNTKAEQDNRLGFYLIAAAKDFSLAKALALGFEISLVDPENAYAYRLIVHGVDTIYTSYNASEAAAVITLPKVMVSEQELKAELSWEIDNYPFWGYYVEVKSGRNAKWIKTNSSPIIQVDTRKDSLGLAHRIIETYTFEKNYAPKEFRIVGVNEFGIEVPGESFEAQGKDKTAPDMPEEAIAKGLTENSIRISWSWQNKSKASDLKYFRIDRATTNDLYFSPYSELLPAKSRTFIDNTPIRLGNNYYRIAAIDTAGNESYSAFAYGMVYDSIAPQTPNNIKASIDSNGIVSITWDRPKEIDVYGYRVYFSNYATHSFINLTGSPLNTEKFIDTINLKTLSKKAYYKIVALDYHFNHSPYSQAIELERPDKNLPQAPLFTSYFCDGKSVKLNWAGSFSEDVQSIIILRRRLGDKDWLRIYEGKNQDTGTYIDQNIMRGEIYEYETKAIDKSGLVSESIKPLKIKVMPFQTLEDISNLKAMPGKETVVLNWQYALQSDIYFVIFRAENEKEFEEIDFVENSLTYTDKKVKSETNYRYAIKPVARKGASGKMSSPIKVQTK
jgi:fibronectin type 3 domain-containing protein